ncbi:MAG: hypothetical protein KDA79_16185 [Planctomycetaceae bacterium]|nr:hypothetical protein [Planctomycetaceae bacterium]
MQSFRIAAVSMNSRHGEYESTFETMADFCRQAAEAGAAVVLFPELVIHGHCNPETFALAEAVPDGPSTARLIELAREYRLILSAGISEKEHDIVFNTQVLCGPEGYIGKQRKLHTSRDENFFYRGGRDIVVHDIGLCRVGTVICYDNQFPEIARILAIRGAEVILMPHSAREGRWHDAETEAKARKTVFEYFRTSYAMRARENGCFCIYADQAGQAGLVDSWPPEHENQPHHPGGAMIFSPSGDLLAHTQTERIRDEMLVHELDAAALMKARSHPNWTIRTRRPELFGELIRDQFSC